METKRCAACGQEFQLKSHSPRQAYCSEPACQRARKRRWQKEKLQTDPDYVDNQARAQQAWCDRHADYWRNYRSEHPDYVDLNREKQHDRNAWNRSKVIAKMDVLTVEIRVPSHLSKLHR
ncbi:MAG: hypothetical protein P4L91_20860 [Burkholderiaceae bacterium]|nr:hypothetical protein [Burkholderiaceae bacterium]